MRRTLWLAPPAVAVLVAVLVVLKPSSSPADPGQPEPAAKAAGTAQLPVAQAILYSSGVGYFQREGSVEGNTRIDLTFPVQDINDLLKSMVLQDLNGGVISAVSYDSQAPIEKTLQSFAINLTGNPGFGAVLGQARGEKVEVTLQQGNAAQPGNVTGTIIGVEKQRQQVGKDSAVDVELLNLWCAEGMRSAKLTDVQRVRFLNPVLDSEFKRALETLALSHDTQKKAVSLSFNGEGKREVRVSYVVENPIWKTSYRLVLPNKKDGKPMLQGWAIVDNSSEEDWKDVRMALLSGRPISFQMDLYQPLYVPRPVVEPELFASLRPPTYQGAMTGKPQTETAGTATYRVKRMEEKLKESKSANGEAERLGIPPSVTAGFMLEAEQRLAQDLDLTKGGASAATASELGDFFQYVIDHPVSLPRHKSAMLPIVQKEVEAARVSIYNERTQAKHPLLGLRFKNTTGMHLMQGPITVFEGSSYAGDARILDITPKDERLISYAIDLGTEVEPVAKSQSDRITKVKINKGILNQTTKVRQEKTYNLKNRSEHDRVVLIEHPFRPDFVLLSKDKPAERTRDVYRFEVKLPAGQTASTELADEKDVHTSIALTNSDDNTMRFFLSQRVVSGAVEDALTKAIELKGKVSDTSREIAQLQKQLKDITDDQARLRANLKEMPATAEAYKRYLKKFDDQETQIEDFQKKIKVLQDTEFRQRKAFEDYLAALDIE
ncbi:MAG TPA: DUF4139 domain-containing protein [Gemmataceae bacterium]|nr:DUF4139 domain-containing protein [Gemmataceae bacterium]